jgi:hypothetical protein
MSNDVKMNDLVGKAIDSLHEFFDNKGQRTSNDIAAARVASSLLATNAREKQAAGARDALSFMIARELSTDKSQLENFLTAAMPNAAVLKALPTASES